MMYQFICYCSYCLMELVSLLYTFKCAMINLSPIINKVYALAEVHIIYICVRLKYFTDIIQSSLSSTLINS